MSDLLKNTEKLTEGGMRNVEKYRQATHKNIKIRKHKMPKRGAKILNNLKQNEKKPKTNKQTQIKT